MKSKKHSWHQLYFIMSVEKYGWAIQKSLFAQTNQDSTFTHIRGNSKLLNITSKYFRFFRNKQPANWVAHIARDFLSCYSCLYYSSMEKLIIKLSFSIYRQKIEIIRNQTDLRPEQLIYKLGCKTIYYVTAVK